MKLKRYFQSGILAYNARAGFWSFKILSGRKTKIQESVHLAVQAVTASV